MMLDDETTAEELKGELARQGVTLLKSTILRCRRSLRSSYCQLIREANKSKRLEWALVKVHVWAGISYRHLHLQGTNGC